MKHLNRKKPAAATPDEIRGLRESAGISIAEAAAIICREPKRFYEFEYPPDHPLYRPIQQDTWQLFQIRIWLKQQNLEKKIAHIIK